MCPAGVGLEEEPQEESGFPPDSLHSYGERPSAEAGMEELQNLGEQQSQSSLLLTQRGLIF